MKEKFLQKLTPKRIFLLLLICYLITRLVNLGIIPIFNDEAIYLDWGYRMVNIKGQFFFSLHDAKPPLLMWIYGLTRKLIPDPLSAGRLLSVVTGFLTAIGLYKITKELYDEKKAQLALFFYIITPLFLFFDRQALMESAVAAIGVWSFYFFIKLIRTKNYKFAALIGIVSGLGCLIKTNSLIFFVLLIIFYIFKILKTKNKDLNLANGIILFSTFIMTLSPLLLNSYFWETLSVNQKYVLTLADLLKFPVNIWFKNTINLNIILLIYLNPLILIFTILSIYSNIRQKDSLKIYLIFYLLLSIFSALILGRTISPRYLVSYLPFVIIFASDFFLILFNKSKIYGFILFSFTVTPLLVVSFLQITFPLKYFDVLDNFSQFSQKESYVTGWTSGYGFDGIKNYLLNESEKSKIIAAVRLDAGIPENAVFAYFQNSDDITPTYLDSRMIRGFEAYVCLASKLPIYFVSRDTHLAGLDRHFEETKRFYKPEGQHYIAVHKLKTNCEGKTLNLN